MRDDKFITSQLRSVAETSKDRDVRTLATAMIAIIDESDGREQAIEAIVRTALLDMKAKFWTLKNCALLSGILLGWASLTWAIFENHLESKYQIKHENHTNNDSRRR
jgi:hypothetical protein